MTFEEFWQETEHYMEDPCDAKIIWDAALLEGRRQGMEEAAGIAEPLVDWDNDATENLACHFCGALIIDTIKSRREEI